jgi:hypothetical protein
MDVPGIVRERLADERRMTSVNVGGDDRVYIAPPKTLVYHASGLFSSESIEEFPHDARRFDVSADRREATFAFEYDDGVQAFSAPRERIETILPPVLAGVLRTTGLIGDEESIEESYRFGERTLVVTDTRVLTSVGEAVWDRDHESYEYETVTDLGFEDGLLVIEIDGQSRRIELGDDGREAYETVETALLAYHGVASVKELPKRNTEQSQDARTDESTVPAGGMGDETHEVSGGTDEIDETEPDTEQNTVTSPPPSSPAPSESPEPPIREATESRERETPVETATTERDGMAADDTSDLSGELDALRESVERQTELLERQQETLERLADTLTQQVSDDQ